MTEWIVTSSALILIVIALRGILKNRITARLRYCLWALVLIRLLIPFSVSESAMSLGNVTQQIEKQPTVQQTTQDVHQYESAYDRILDRYAELGIAVTPDQIREEARDQVYTDTYAHISNNYENQGIPVTDTQIRQETHQRLDAVQFRVTLQDALPVIWYTGMILVGLALILSNLRFGQTLVRSRRKVSRDILPIYVSSAVATPCLFGFPFPAIYLTQEAMEDEQTQRHVLAHEMSHYRQGDHIWSALRLVCLVLHWYNPLVWIAVHLSKRDGEMACDERTLKVLGEEERAAYGRTLIGMTCVRHDPRNLLLSATTMIGSKQSLKERIQSIAKKTRPTVLALIACLVAVCIAVGCTFTGAPTEPTEPTEPSTAPTTESTEPTTEPTIEPTTESTEPGVVSRQPVMPHVGNIQRDLTGEELEAFETMFQYTFDGSIENWYSMAIKTEYADPADIDLFYYFYSPPLAEATAEDERFYLDALGKPKVLGVLHKYPMDKMDEVLRGVFGIGLADTKGVGLDRMVYNPEQNCYYHEHGDFSSGHPNFYRGYANPGMVTLFHSGMVESGNERKQQNMILKLQYVGGDGPFQWKVISFTPMFYDTSWLPTEEETPMSSEEYFAQRREFLITNTPYRSVWECDIDGDTVAWRTGYGLDYAEGFVVLAQDGTNTYRTDGRRTAWNKWKEPYGNRKLQVIWEVPGSANLGQVDCFVSDGRTVYFVQEQKYLKAMDLLTGRVTPLVNADRIWTDKLDGLRLCDGKVLYYIAERLGEVTINRIYLPTGERETLYDGISLDGYLCEFNFYSEDNATLHWSVLNPELIPRIMEEINNDESEYWNTSLIPAEQKEKLQGRPWEEIASSEYVQMFIDRLEMDDVFMAMLYCEYDLLTGEYSEIPGYLRFKGIP